MLVLWAETGSPDDMTALLPARRPVPRKCVQQPAVLQCHGAALRHLRLTRRGSVSSRDGAGDHSESEAAEPGGFEAMAIGTSEAQSSCGAWTALPFSVSWCPPDEHRQRPHSSAETRIED